MTTDPLELAARLGMQPHPEGGHYVETWRGGGPTDDGREAASAILFLLCAGERSHWHRVDAAELWLFHAGDPLTLSIAAGISDTDAHEPEHHTLGPSVLDGERPQIVVPAGAWQAAETTGSHTLVSCVVAPAFEFAGFELAAPGWSPGA